MAFGIPNNSRDFFIGQAELRVGPQSMANKLTQADNVGLIDNVFVRFTPTSVDLKGGLPKVLYDTAITEFGVTIEGRAYEYSRKNLKLMVNEGVDASPPAKVSGLLTAPSPLGDTTIDTDIPFASVTINDLFTIYPAASPEKVSMVKATAIANTGGNATITIDNTKTPLLFAYATGDAIYRNNSIPIGKSVITNYFAVEVWGINHANGKPIAYKCWKAAISTGLEWGFTSDNFASTPLTFKVLQPGVEEYGIGGDLLHLDGIIPNHPYGMIVHE